MAHTELVTVGHSSGHTDGPWVGTRPQPRPSMSFYQYFLNPSWRKIFHFLFIRKLQGFPPKAAMSSPPVEAGLRDDAHRQRCKGRGRQEIPDRQGPGDASVPRLTCSAADL